MSQENVEIVRGGYEAFNRGDIDGVLDLCAPDVEWQDAGTFDTPAVTGKDAVRAYFQTVMEPWGELRRETPRRSSTSAGIRSSPWST